MLNHACTGAHTQQQLNPEGAHTQQQLNPEGAHTQQQLNPEGAHTQQQLKKAEQRENTTPPPPCTRHLPNAVDPLLLRP